MDSASADLTESNPEDWPQELESVLFDKETIARRVAELGAAIARDYDGRPLVLIAVLKGGIFFLSDLSREITLPHEFDLVGAQSYKGGTRPTEDITITKDLDLDIEGKDVLIVEDIYDTGGTLGVIRKMLEIHQPASIEVCALLNKKKDRTDRIELKYIGFNIEDVFVVGYGLDYKEKFRNLPCIGVLRPEIYQ